MPELSRRAFLAGAPSFGAALALGGCVATPPPAEPMPAQATLFMPGPADNLANPNYTLMYAAVPGDRFPIPAVDLARIDPAFLRAEVYFPTPEPPGTIVIDPARPLPLLHAARRPRDPLRRRRRQAGLCLVGRRDHQQQAGMAGLVSAEGDDRRASRSSRPQLHAAAERHRRARRPAATRSARAPCISGRTARTRSTASTAPSSRGRSAPASRPAASA